jgi:hypothetical protein
MFNGVKISQAKDLYSSAPWVTEQATYKELVLCKKHARFEMEFKKECFDEITYG